MNNFQPTGGTVSYDAWNRLVKVADGANTVAEYAYDGLNRRIVKRIYSGGTLDHTRHIYLSTDWQTLEERLDSSINPDRQFTWGTRYVDDLALRTRDTDNNGTLDETLYALQDANWHITALTDVTGTITERLKYDPYGKSTILDADFTPDADNTSEVEWEYRFTSREYDLDTGLHYFRNRYYDAHIASFLSRDQLSYIDGMNLYTPYFIPNVLDPSGNGFIPPRPCCVCKNISYWSGSCHEWDCCGCPNPPSSCGAGGGGAGPTGSGVLCTSWGALCSTFMQCGADCPPHFGIPGFSWVTFNRPCGLFICHFTCDEFANLMNQPPPPPMA